MGFPSALSLAGRRSTVVTLQSEIAGGRSFPRTTAGREHTAGLAYLAGQPIVSGGMNPELDPGACVRLVHQRFHVALDAALGDLEPPGDRQLASILEAHVNRADSAGPDDDVWQSYLSDNSQAACDFVKNFLWNHTASGLDVNDDPVTVRARRDEHFRSLASIRPR
jgi:hypothetical protein